MDLKNKINSLGSKLVYVFSFDCEKICFLGAVLTFDFRRIFRQVQNS